ncbi:MAG TPA: septum formation initiator family protein [Candidatus Brocadiaceae bacterium]
MFTIAISLAVFVVYEKNKMIEIGYQVAKLQKNYAKLSETNRKLKHHVDRLKSPEIIALKVQSLKLPLIPQEESSEILVANQIKCKENMMQSVKTSLNKDLYTQKDFKPIF